MLSSSVISRVRDYLGQQLATGEVVQVAADARQQSVRTALDDENLLQRIYDAEIDIISSCDACASPLSVRPYLQAEGLDPVAPDVARILESTIFRDGVRCQVVDADNTSVRKLNRAATAARPVAAIGGGSVTVYPDATNVTMNVVTVPTLFTLADMAAGTDVLAVGDILEEAVVQHVLASVRISLAHNGIEVDMYTTMAKVHQRLYDQEIEPFLLNNRVLSRQADEENSVESRQR